jgi:hypothetical protein
VVRVTAPARCAECGGLRRDARRDAYLSGYEAGRAPGLAEGTRIRADLGIPVDFQVMLPELIALCHSDRHRGGRRRQIG